MAFGGLLRDHRLRMGWTQEDLADRSGMSVHAISVLESGKRRPRLTSLAHLADALGLGGAEREALIAAARTGDAAGSASGRVGAEVPQQSTSTGSGKRPEPPAKVGHFCGRYDELAELQRVLALNALPRPIIVLSGPAGIGKTATAVELAHIVAHRFPDGCLFVDLGGHRPSEAVTVDDALARLLSCLGITGPSVPPGRHERASMFRSAVSGRAILLILDNAGGTEQVLPLLPDDDGCGVLITSRRDLAALGTHRPVVALTLDAMNAQESMTLLGRVIGDRRVVENITATGEIADFCDGFPLALRICAARLNADGGLSPGVLAEEMRKERRRLAALVVEDGARSIRSAFASAYRGLDEAVQQTFRRLGAYPGVTITASALAAMNGVPFQQASADLAVLSAHNLVQVAGDQRYTLHDLIRLFARERSEEEDADAGEAFERLALWLLRVAICVNEAVSPGNRALIPEPLPGSLDIAVPLALPQDQRGALQLVQDEIDNLAPLMNNLTARGHHAATAQVGYLLAGALDRLQPTQALAITGAGVTAAEALGDPATRRALHAAFCAHSLNLRRPAEALEHALLAVALVDTLDSITAKASTYIMLGRAYGQLRQYRNAVEAYERAIAHYRLADNGPGLAMALNNISGDYIHTGRFGLALEVLTEAVETSSHIGDARSGAYANSSLGALYVRLGDADRAEGFLAAGLDLAREIGDVFHEVWTLGTISDRMASRQAFGEALDCLEGALRICRRIEHRHGEALIRRRLGTVHLLLENQPTAGEHLLRALDLWSDAYEELEQARLHHALCVFADREGQKASADFHRHVAARLFRQVAALSEAERVESGQPPAFP